MTRSRTCRENRLQPRNKGSRKVSRNDHYVAETYLKHFLGPDKFLYAYRKSNGKQFPTRPDSICHELDGDLIPDFLSDPTLLGQYRTIFEPQWSLAVEELKAGSLSHNGKFAIAGYWANLLVFTPARCRLDVKMHDRAVVQHLTSRHTLLSDIGRSDPELGDAVDALTSGIVRVETEPDAMRAMRVRHVLRLAWALYNSDWTIIRNTTGAEFVTSDNPVAFEDPGPWRGTAPPLRRFLPVTQTLCLICLPRPPGQKEPNFDKPPRGEIRIANLQREGVRRINRAIAQCAEDLVIPRIRLPESRL